MATPSPEIIGIIVSGIVAGLVLIIVFIIVAVYCYRAIDSSDDRKLLKKKRQLYYAENGTYLPEPVYYGESVSSVGTTARLVPPYSVPVMYGKPSPYPREDYPSPATTLEKAKRKKGKPRSVRKDEPILGFEDANLYNPDAYQMVGPDSFPAFVSHLRTMDRSSKYDEREKHMEFGEENRDSREGSIQGENPVTTDTPTVQPTEDEPVIVTYLEERSQTQQTEVKSVQTTTAATADASTAPPPAPLAVSTAVSTADPDNGEHTPSGEDSEDELYHKRQREPPKGDVNPPVAYRFAEGGAVLY